MTESIIVRTAIILYAIIAAIASVLLWRNSAASDALKNSGILIAAILPVLIAVLPYINVKEESKRYNFILLYDSKQKTLTMGDQWNPYESIYMNMFTNLSEAPPTMISGDLNEFQKKGIDIIEKGIVEAMMFRFSSHWDVVWRQNRGPNYISFSGSKGAMDSSKQITLEEIRNEFSHNPLISTHGIVEGVGFHIPPDSTVTVSQPGESRVITIASPYSIVSIAVKFSSLMVAQQGIWHILKADPQNLNRYYTVEYAVTLTIRPKRFKKYSPTMESYVRWHENIENVLQNYDWEHVEKQIEQRAMREAIAKITEKKTGLIKDNH